MMGRVFVVQESGKNVSQAREFGELAVLLPVRSNIAIDAAPHVALLTHKLRDFCDADYLLLCGDPAAIGLACAIAASVNGGRYKCLKWDKQDMLYYDVQIILKKGELIDAPEDRGLNQRIRRGGGLAHGTGGRGQSGSSAGPGQAEGSRGGRSSGSL